ncbi:MAG: ABC transporter permease [Nitratireductor sp.]
MIDAALKSLQSARDGRRRRMAPIVPAQTVAGHALIAVIAIMTFLACLTVGAVTLVRDTASVWQSQIAREATIQIRPRDDLDMEAALEAARTIAGTFAGVREATVVDSAATARLLEPWLGTGLDLEELPVPRLVIVTIDEAAPPDFDTMREAIRKQVPNASLDDHRNWVDRLVSMARTTVTIGFTVLILMLSATVLTVIFATRGAMAGNGHVIEVLHYVGAEARFIASQFRRHFLLTGIKGAAAGGLAAIVVFILFGWWSGRNMATPEADQATALFGNFAIGMTGYLGVGVVVVLVAALTAATSHATVVAHLNGVDVGTADHL